MDVGGQVLVEILQSLMNTVLCIETVERGGDLSTEQRFLHARKQTWK